jgi:NADH-ubiquinone oxidoreductase chain 5
MAIPLICLAFGSIFIGYLTRDMIIGLGTNFFEHSIFVLPKNLSIIDSEFIPTYIKLIPLFFSVLGAVVSFGIFSSFGDPKYAYDLKMNFLGNKIYKYLNKK